MSGAAYPACLRELYESEIFGEAAILALLDLVEDARDRYHLGTLLQLETETKARLRPLLHRHGLSLSEDMDLGDVAGVVETYRGGTWREFAAKIKAVAETYLARFEEIARQGPAEDREILESMVRHEASILRWLDMESRGETEGSLDAMIAQLNHPLPEPHA
ncbi:MAG: hypothetical protein ACYTG2_13800 [Planctomycetota bacterium]|jgi:hypothetical protein